MAIDGTERPRNRPKDKEQQRKHCSGKKKRHTMKNTVAADPRAKQVLALTVTTQDSVHDKGNLDNSEIILQRKWFATKPMLSFPRKRKSIAHLAE
ncbi:MAG: hypothetical protein JNJ94_02595 [Chlorobi bacterium]|nr:hypothetical protein [Chlorobiota bacterium]